MFNFFIDIVGKIRGHQCLLYYTLALRKEVGRKRGIYLKVMSIGRTTWPEKHHDADSRDTLHHYILLR